MENTTTPIRGWQAFANGLKRSLRYPQVLFAAYVFNLLTALLLVILPALLLIGPAHSTSIRDAANGIDAWMVQEILMAPTNQIYLGGAADGGLSSGITQGWLVTLLTLLVIPLFAWLPASFIGGGILLTYAEAPQPFAWRRFLWGCWHWFGAFLGINLLLGLLTSLLVTALVTGAGFGLGLAGSWFNWISIPLSVLVLVPWLAIVEYTRLLAVTGGTRNVFVTFGRAFVLAFRRAPDLAVLYALALLLLALVHAIFRPLLLALPLDWWPLYFVVAQAFILLRLWARMIRWAGALDVR
jgi:hypothetical protein